MTLPKLKGNGPALDAADHDRNILFLSGFPSLAAMLADTARGYGFYEPGQTVLVLKEGFRYRVAASGATDHHLSTAAGLKLHVLPGDDGVYNFRAFNPAANGTTNDYAKLMLALGVVAEGEAPHKRGPTIYFPDPAYAIGSTVELNKIVHLIGTRSSPAGTSLIFPNGVSGIVVNDFNTANGTAISEAEATSRGLSGAGGSVIEGIICRGPSAPAARGSAVGLRLRAPARILDCAFWNFNDAGVLIEAWDPADVPGSPHLWGDARGWYMKGVTTVHSGRSGLRVRGTRSGDGMCILGNFTYSGHFGLDDHQPGGNTYLACHTATNGVGAAAGNFTEPRKGSSVNHGGSMWRAVYKIDANGDPDPDHLAALVTTEPGTDPEVWAYRAPQYLHTWYPNWVSGQAPGHYFPGGSYKISHSSSSSINIGSYAEDDDGNGAVYNGAGVLVAGGLQNGIYHGSRFRGGHGGQLNLGSGATIGPDDVHVVLQGGGGKGARLTLDMEGEVWNFLRWEGPDLVIDHDGDDPVLRIPGTFTEEDFGTGFPAEAQFRPHFPTLGLGHRRHERMTAAPTTGEWAKGDLVWNRDPSAGGNAAWSCVESGTPGRWQPCMPIAI